MASEVRALAQRTAEAAKEIAVLINANSRQIAEGVSLAGQSEDQLTSIAAAIQQLDELAQEIARSAKTQAASISDISAAIEQIDDATQRNAAMIEENTAASRSLATEAETLADIIAGFREHPEDEAPAGALPGRPLRRDDDGTAWRNIGERPLVRVAAD